MFRKINTPNSTLLKRVYVLEFSNGTVKIGVSNNLNRRAKQLCCSSGMKIRNYAYTKHINNAYQIEKLCHSVFSKSRLTGEFFRIDFKNACKVLSNYEPLAFSTESTKTELEPAEKTELTYEQLKDIWETVIDVYEIETALYEHWGWFYKTKGFEKDTFLMNETIDALYKLIDRYREIVGDDMRQKFIREEMGWRCIDED